MEDDNILPQLAGGVHTTYAGPQSTAVLPSRDAFVAVAKVAAPAHGDPLPGETLVHITDAQDHSTWDRGQQQYQLQLFGSTPDGARAQVTVVDVPVYFDVKPRAGRPADEERALLMEACTNPLRSEVVRQFEAVGLADEPVEWLRIHFSGLNDRDTSLDSILQYRNFKLSLPEAEKTPAGETVWCFNVDQRSCRGPPGPNGGARRRIYRDLGNECQAMNMLVGSMPGFRGAAPGQRETGGTWGKKVKCAVVTFDTEEQAAAAVAAIRARNFATAADDPKSAFYRKVAREQRIPLVGWAALKPRAATEDRTRGCTVHKYTVGPEAIRALVDPLDPPEKQEAGEAVVAADPRLQRERTLVMSWDIETHVRPDCYTGDAPDPEMDGTCVFMIACTFQWKGRKLADRGAGRPLAQVVLTSAPAPPDPRWATVVCASEADLLMAFAHLWRRTSPDVETQFNGFGYDWPFVARKLNQKGLFGKWLALTSMLRDPLNPRDADNDQAYKWNFRCGQDGRGESYKLEAGLPKKLFYVTVAGTAALDISVPLHKITCKKWDVGKRRTLRNYLAANKLEAKDDLDYKVMWRIYERVSAEATVENIEAMREVAHYCVVDARACHALECAKSVLDDGREVASLSWTSMYDSLFRADGVRVQNYVQSNDVHVFNVARSNARPEGISDEKFEGAIVQQPVLGLHRRKPFTGLDFASLYPSIFMDRNISPEAGLYTREDFDAYLAKHPELDEERDFRHIAFQYEGKTVQGWYKWHHNKDEQFALFPRILKFLFQTRKAIKKKKAPYDHRLEELEQEISALRGNPRRTEAENETLTKLEAEYDDVEYIHGDLDRKQLARKVLMNTFYGVTGCRTNPLYWLPVAGAITAVGRLSITLVRGLCEEMGFGIEYGDTDSLYISSPDASFVPINLAYNDGDLEGALASGAYDRAMRAEMAKPCDHGGCNHSTEGREPCSCGSKCKDECPCVAAGGCTPACDCACAGGLRTCKCACHAYERRCWRRGQAGPRPDEDVATYDTAEKLKTRYWAELVQIAMDDMTGIRNHVNDTLAELNGTRYLNMAYEEVIFPGGLLGKKNYFGIPHEGLINFRPRKLFVRGGAATKRDASGIVRAISDRIMWAAMALFEDRDLTTITLDVLRDAVVNSSQWDLGMFAMSLPYKPLPADRKKGNPTLRAFLENMAPRRAAEMAEAARLSARGQDPPPAQYELPGVGDRIQYIVAKRPTEFTLQGTRLSDKVGLRMEYLHVAKARGLRPDMAYYIEGKVAGLCGRFVMGAPRFDLAADVVARLTPQQVDKKRVDAAKKFIVRQVQAWSGADPDALKKQGYALRREYKAARAVAQERLANVPGAMLLTGAAGAKPTSALGKHDFAALVAAGDATPLVALAAAAARAPVVELAADAWAAATLRRYPSVHAARDAWVPAIGATTSARKDAATMQILVRKKRSEKMQALRRELDGLMPQLQGVANYYEAALTNLVRGEGAAALDLTEADRDLLARANDAWQALVAGEVAKLREARLMALIDGRLHRASPSQAIRNEERAAATVTGGPPPRATGGPLLDRLC